MLATGHFLRNQVFTCLNGQLGALETPCGAKKPHSSVKNLVSEPSCKKCPVVNFYVELHHPVKRPLKLGRTNELSEILDSM
jgi:hypothetical protein